MNKNFPKCWKSKGCTKLVLGRFDLRKIDTSVGGLVELHVLGVGLVWLVYASIITLVATYNF